MSKVITQKFSGMSWLLAASLAATLAAYGCSSNQYAGNGQPTSMMPTINSVNHSTTYGSSSGTEGTPPMASSYVNPSARRVDVDALAILAAEQGFRGRVLGPVNPDGYLPGVTIATGQFVSPAQQVYPQSTVNSSINSQPSPAIGTDGGITIAASGIAAGTPTAVGTTVASPAAMTSAVTATPVAATGALTTSTGAGSTVASSASFAPAMMNSTPAPQATGTTNRTLPNVVATGRATKANTKTASTARSTSTTSAARTANVNVVSGIQLQTNSTGGVMMTNVANTAPTVKGK